MKTLALTVLAAVLLGLSSGCSTPGYSAQERFQLIGRNWGYEYEQMQDDIDHFFLLRPATHLTYWNVQ
jgi:geranylgeranyl pyrophosphate synthase